MTDFRNKRLLEILKYEPKTTSLRYGHPTGDTLYKAL